MDRNELARFFAAFWGIDVSGVSDSLRIDSTNLPNFSSIRFYQFIAAVESNLDAKVANLNRIITFRDLLENSRP